MKRHIIASETGTLDMQGADLKTPDADRGRALMESAAESGITSMKTRRYGKFWVSVVRGRLTPIVGVRDRTLTIGAGPIGFQVTRRRTP